MRSFVEGAVLGNFANNTSYSAIAGQTLVGLTPFGVVADVRDTAAAINAVRAGADGAGVMLAGAIIGWVPGIGDAIKAGLRSTRRLAVEFVEAGTQQTVTRTLRAVPESVTVNALRSFETRRMQFGEHTFQLDLSGMKHILQRHHPEFWNGSLRNQQTFLNPNMTINDVSEAVHDIMKQNRETLMQRGTNDSYQVTGMFLGQQYVVGVTNGRVRQFYPLVPGN